MNHEHSNRANSNARTGYAAVQRWVLVLVVVSIFWMSAGSGLGQELPHIPVREPRPAEGAEPHLRWQIGVDPGALPSAGLLEPLRGNDAVIQVVFGQTRLLTLKKDLSNGPERGSISVGDPTVVDFDLMANPRVIRLLARRPGVTDLSIMTPDGEVYNFEVHVIYDLRLLDAQLRQLYPDAQVRLSQLHGYVVVEGQVRSIRQADQVMSTVKLFLMSHAGERSQDGRQAGAPAPARSEQPASRQADLDDQAAFDEPSPREWAQPEQRGQSNVEYSQAIYEPINLLRVPGVHQVMLQVQIAELNRTALRGIGADLFYRDSSGRTFGTNVSGTGSQSIFAEQFFVTDPSGRTTTVTGPEQLIGLLPAAAATGYALFPATHLDVTLRALRTNGVMSILAEPNLVAMSGEKAQFLAGGEIPIPRSTLTGGAAEVSIDWRQYGVQLEFQPFVLEDETIRLTVRPEESALDYANAIEVAGSLVPALTTRQVTTTVEMRQGQTLAMAGLLRVSIAGNTTRIPGLGDLPYIGPLFSNTSHQRVEKELMILVTPYLVAPMNPDEVPCLPTDGMTDPNDLEFYLLNRIEGRTGRPFNSTREWDDPWKLRYLLRLEESGRYGPVGFLPVD